MRKGLGESTRYKCEHERRPSPGLRFRCMDPCKARCVCKPVFNSLVGKDTERGVPHGKS